MSRLPASPAAVLAPTILLAILGSVGIAPVAHAATRTVTNCNDSGEGSLRTAVVGAANGDIVDMRGLRCGTIYLNGAIPIRVPALQILGPGFTRLTVNGRERGRVFQQDVPMPGFPPRIEADLILRGFTVSWGRVAAKQVLGGCILAQSRLTLQSMQVHHCTAQATGTDFDRGASGGGVFGWNSVRLTFSFVHSNRALSNGSGGGVSAERGLNLESSRVAYNTVDTNGGGVFAILGFTMYLSTVDHNTVTDGSAGGIATAGAPQWINKSTISYNHAVIRAVGEFDPGYPLRFVESTISHNSADFDEPGIEIFGAGEPAEILNSTIVFNTAAAESFPGGCERGAGLAVDGTVRLNGSIVAGNTCAGNPSDVGVGQEIDAPTLLFGADNLVGTAFIPVPPDTIFANDPRVGPLANNGGTTQTHLPLSDSQAIDAGNNGPDFLYDQRSAGFPRVKGVRADIGAVER